MYILVLLDILCRVAISQSEAKVSDSIKGRIVRFCM